MNRKFALTLCALLLNCGVNHAAPLGTLFTYQGQLDFNGQPANGSYQMTFWLYANFGGGTPIASNIVPTVAVNDGLFTRAVDFGVNPATGRSWFDADERWLAITVATNGSTAFTLLQPRTRVSPAPQSLYAVHAGTANTVTNGAIQAAQLSAGIPANGQVLGFNNGSLVWQPAATPGNAWALTGNSAALGSFLGTINAQPLELRANNNRALRLEPGADSPNVVGGWNGNIVNAGVSGAAIGGGGAAIQFGMSASNRVTDDFGTIAGGAHNVSGNDNGAVNDGYFATVGGGHFNVALGIASTIAGGAENRATNNNSSIGGGYQNVASGFISTIGGGQGNRALNAHSVVGGGLNNQVIADAGIVAGGSGNQVTGVGAGAVGGGTANTASGDSATVPGGFSNLAQGRSSFAAGNAARALHNGSFVWADRQGTVFSPTPYESTANNQFSVRASGGVRFETPTLEVIGNVTTRVLTITGGADLAEPFPMKEEQIEKGSVVVIDRELSGRLRRSTQAYDKRVAGIVSGANGIHPGIALQQAGALDQGRNVALTGRVYVKADASFGEIEPGDLLTTSDTPGHAMKVCDHAKSQGAILGKAMSTLKEGQGLVLVLVTLQ